MQVKKSDNTEKMAGDQGGHLRPYCGSRAMPWLGVEEEQSPPEASAF